MIQSLLPIVQKANNFPPHPHSPCPTHSPDGSERYVPFHLTLADHQAGRAPLGVLKPRVVKELLQAILPTAVDTSKGEETSKIWLAFPDGGKEGDEECVYFAAQVLSKGPDGMSEIVARVVGGWKADGKFPGPLSSWRDELYQVYHPANSSAPALFPSIPSTPSAGGTMTNKAFTLERAACSIFGVATFGVHVRAYEYRETGDGGEKAMMVWVPRRAKTKRTYPGLLDSTVGGGLTAGMTALECVIKECGEEAGLPADFVRSRVKCVGVMMEAATNEDGYHEFGADYLYDLALPPPSSPDYIKPAPFDGEVEAFELLDLPTIHRLLFAGEFKPNSGAMMVDFLLRHGYLTPEIEPNLLQIRWELSRNFGLAVPC